MNKVILIGRLTKDVDNNGKVSRFTVAVNRFKKEDGADFIDCVAFGKTGDTIAQYLNKGSQIALEGRLNLDKYTNKHGETRYTTRVLVDRFEFVGGKAEPTAEPVADIVNDVLEDGLELDYGDTPF